MKAKYFIELTLSEEEGVALEKVLGSINDDDYSSLYNLTTQEIEYVHNIYAGLPHSD